ncbi:MAG: hypothetical protein J1E00_05165 [Oscillospiraceae bacterium]|nr:hypothetical protein [Oscillospiraceae bacterium]
METKEYARIAEEIFGRQPAVQTEEFNAEMEAQLGTLTPAEKEAVLSACLEGKAKDGDYAKGMRKLRHPTRSKKLLPFMQPRGEN